MPEDKNSKAASKLMKAVLHVLEASEDGGDMDDIDFDFLRKAVKYADENGIKPE